jgi:hypothetical protein
MTYREPDAWISFSQEAGAKANLLTFQRPCQDQKRIKLVSDPRGSRELGKNQTVQIDEMFPECTKTCCTPDARFGIKAAGFWLVPTTQVVSQNSPLPISHPRRSSARIVIRCFPVSRRIVMCPPKPFPAELSLTTEDVVNKHDTTVSRPWTGGRLLHTLATLPPS